MEAINERTTDLNACEFAKIDVQQSDYHDTDRDKLNYAPKQSNVWWQKSLFFPVPLTEQVNAKCRSHAGDN